MTLPRCLCCDRPFTPVACLDGWCAVCVGQVLKELLFMADMKPGEVATVADILRMCGALTMAQAITRTPFEPNRATLTRLTDE